MFNGPNGVSLSLQSVTNKRNRESQVLKRSVYANSAVKASYRGHTHKELVLTLDFWPFECRYFAVASMASLRSLVGIFNLKNQVLQKNSASFEFFHLCKRGRTFKFCIKSAYCDSQRGAGRLATRLARRFKTRYLSKTIH